MSLTPEESRLNTFLERYACALEAVRMQKVPR